MREQPKRKSQKMVDEQVPFKVEAVVKTYRFCYPEDKNEELVFGLCPLRLGEKTLAVTSGFYRELITNSCRIKLSPQDALRYLWHFRNSQRLDVFSQN